MEQREVPKTKRDARQNSQRWKEANNNYRSTLQSRQRILDVSGSKEAIDSSEGQLRGRICE